jgi:hypothetical protein
VKGFPIPPRPGTVAAGLLAIGPVEDTGIAQIPVGAGEAAGEVGFLHTAERAQEMSPDGAHDAIGVDHLVGDIRKRRIGVHRLIRGLYRPAFRFHARGLQFQHS